ncbi:MAG TPA: MBL fold metallo-hydrolase [Candidatus Paceibacterota bacterium]|nr:MBL fold metallo-hydrolase [Candidatus Paceibacterota bacterium]
MKVTFYSGVGSVTGANFLLENGESRVLVDCGMTQGAHSADQFDINAKPFGYDPASIDVLFVTHAHMDHVGRIPKLVRDGFKGVIYSHPATKDLSELMLPDAFAIMAEDAKRFGKEPYFSQADIDAAFSMWKTVSYYVPTELAGYTVTLKDAGHVLGSTMFFFEKGGKTVVFTGDLGNSPSPLLRDTDSVDGADYLVMESVYGDRNHENRDSRIDKLERVINETMRRGGALVIPAFSLERTQMILYELNDLFERKKIPSVPVFVDSPLAIKVTEVYKRYENLFNDTAKGVAASGDDIFAFPKLSFTLRREQSEAIEKTANPKIILAGSGMSMGGRIQSHEADHIEDPKSTILLVGYQTPGSLGRRLLDGVKETWISGRKRQVRAQIDMIEGFSGHKDSDHLLEFVDEGKSKLKKVFVVMGEPKSSMFLAQRLRDYVGVDAIFPEAGKGYELK